MRVSTARALLLCGALGPASAGAQGKRACTLGAWEPMQHLTTMDHRPVYIETPSWSTTPSGTAVIGFPTYVWQTNRVFAMSGDDQLKRAVEERSAGVFMRRDGRIKPIHLPLGVDDPAAMHAVDSGTGTIDVLWGTVPDSSFVGAGLAARRIMEAQTDGDAWSHPSPVIELERIFWNNTQPAVIGTRSGIEVAVPAYGREHDVWHSGIVMLVRGKQGWSHSWIETGLPPGYVALSVDSHNAGILAFIGGTASPKEPMPYGIYAARRRGDELSWDAPRSVLTLGARGLAGPPVLLRARNGTVHLVWADQPVAAREGPASIHHMISADAGTSWSPLPDLHCRRRSMSCVPS